MSHQRPRLVQLLVRRRHQQGYRVELAATTPRPRSTRSRKCESRRRISRPSTAAAPGATITGRHASSGTQGFPRHRGVLQARRQVERRIVVPPASVRCGPASRAVRTATVHASTTLRGRGRSGARSRHRIQQGPEQAVLLLVAGHAAAHRPGHAAAEHRCRRPSSGLGTSRRRSTVKTACGDQGSEPAAQVWHVQQQYRRARRASRTTRSRPIASTRSARRCSACSRCRTRPIRPAASQYNYTFQNELGTAAQRPGDADGLQRRTATRRSTPACSGGMKSTRAARTLSSAPAPARRQRRLAAATPPTRSTPSA